MTVPFEAVLGPLLESWRVLATSQRDRLADARAAQIIENLSAELVAFAREADTCLLTSDEAAAWSGYSVDHLRRLCDRGVIKNYGRRGAPLYLRSELPRKPTRTRSLTPVNEPGIMRDPREQIARAVIKRHGGGR